MGRYIDFLPNPKGWGVCSQNSPRSLPVDIAELHFTASPDFGPVIELFQVECGWKRDTPLPVLAPTIPASPSVLFSVFPPHPSSDRCPCPGRRSLYQPGFFHACVEPTNPTAYNGLQRGQEICFHHFKPVRFGGCLGIAMINRREKTTRRKEQGGCKRKAVGSKFPSETLVSILTLFSGFQSKHTVDKF